MWRRRRQEEKKSRPQQSMKRNEEFMLHCLVSCRDIVRNLQIFFYEEPFFICVAVGGSVEGAVVTF